MKLNATPGTLCCPGWRAGASQADERESAGHRGRRPWGAGAALSRSGGDWYHRHLRQRTVSLSNLQRQVVDTTAAVGIKTASAKATLEAIDRIPKLSSIACARMRPMRSTSSGSMTSLPMAAIISPPGFWSVTRVILPGTFGLCRGGPVRRGRFQPSSLTKSRPRENLADLSLLHWRSSGAGAFPGL